MTDFRTLSIFLVSTLLLSCQLLGDKGSGNASDITEVKAGYSFGFCAGYCKADFLATSSTQSLTLKSHGRSNDPPDLFEEIELESAEWSRIQNSLNLSRFCQMDDVYGCPDCADGGAEYVTLLCEGKEKTVTFEYGANLPEIRDLLDEIRPLRDSLVASISSR